MTTSLFALGLGGTEAAVGVLMALFALLPMLLSVSAGRLIDRIGPRRPLLVAFAVLAPLAAGVEGFKVDWSGELLAAIAFLVIFASILGVSVLNYLMRHGAATRVASMMYLPPVFAVALEAALFGAVPSGLALAGIAVTCLGVAMTVWSRRWKSSISSS